MRADIYLEELIRDKFSGTSDNWQLYYKKILSKAQSVNSSQELGDWFIEETFNVGHGVEIIEVKDSFGSYYSYVNSGNHGYAFLQWIGYSFYS